MSEVLTIKNMTQTLRRGELESGTPKEAAELT
jgi:hypothetical protein